ncbi:hypothetical protein BJY04DRAFT_180382 [Aspergillus karnatakaensis]|uniref:putative C2H2 finger domain protein n=1 Tax=Aspergillus karnatakaensis TaxID=1810916 RepID=UPI003CCDBAFB
MDGHYHHQYPDFQAFPMGHMPIVEDVHLYPHDAEVLATSMPDAMMGCVPMACDNAVKSAPFPPYSPLAYPHPPTPEMTYWSPAFEESVRSASPQTDSQSGCFSTHYDDSGSCASGFESSPSPSYPEMPVVGIYSPESMNAVEPIQTIQPIAQGNSMFVQVYSSHPPEYTTPASASPSEPTSSKPARKAPAKKNTRSRVQKRGKPAKKTPARPSRTEAETTTKATPKKQTDRRFECCFARYGCTSTFPSKNEWKRHVSSQHIQPGFFRCDIGRCSLNNLKRDTSQSDSQTPSPISPHPHSHSHSPPHLPSTPTTPTLLINDFNRKDLFIQHQRRMHAPWVSTKRKEPVSKSEKDAFEATLADISKRCWVKLRPLPTLSQCGFCDQEFRGANAWKERMEHVARHLEKADPGPEREDVPLREWGVRNGVLRWEGERCWLVGLCGK